MKQGLSYWLTLYALDSALDPLPACQTQESLIFRMQTSPSLAGDDERLQIGQLMEAAGDLVFRLDASGLVCFASARYAAPGP